MRYAYYVVQKKSSHGLGLLLAWSTYSVRSTRMFFRTRGQTSTRLHGLSAPHSYHLRNLKCFCKNSGKSNNGLSKEF
jgi:hypothetical protein